MREIITVKNTKMEQLEKKLATTQLALVEMFEKIQPLIPLSETETNAEEGN